MGDQEKNLVEFPGILVLILKISKGHNTNLWSFFLRKKTLWPLFMDGVQLPQG